MATQSGNPFYGNSRNGSMPIDSSTRSLALDNLIRRELKVSDPNNPQEIADALLTRYKDRPQALSIRREAEGVPFLPAAAPALPAQATTSSSAELQQAIDDVERDLQELTTNSILKDVKVELEGWASAIRSAIQEGVNAARFALDTRQRDKTFGIRRTLGDYARMARLVGALTPTLNINYRKLAQSLDEVASVLLVMMGEALANVGFSGGRFLLQVPYSELQVRRDAVIGALRNLVGSTQAAYGPNDWPRGLDAYRRLFEELENQGQGDLRALLVENELSRMMDSLIQRAAHGNVDGLRQLGSTAQLDLERFRRLVIIAQRLVRPESPPLATFLSALQLFANAFNNAGGFRLMKIARPPIVFYGLYGTSGLDNSDRILMELIQERGRLAEELDCLMACSCDINTVRCQILLDKILYDLDRAIDLYILSAGQYSLPEKRACAYSIIIDSFISPSQESLVSSVLAAASSNSRITDLVQIASGNLDDGVLERIRKAIEPKGGLLGDSFNNLVQVGRQVATLLNIHRLRQESNSGGTSINHYNLIIQITGTEGPIPPVVVQNFDNLALLFERVYLAQNWLFKNDIDVETTPSLSDAVWRNFLNVIHQELCIQEDMEKRWENLVLTMAPSCTRFIDDIFPLLNALIEDANATIGSIKCEPYDIKIPPHYETSLDTMNFGVDSDGAGRL